MLQPGASACWLQAFVLISISPRPWPLPAQIKSLDICVAPAHDGKKRNSLQRAIAQFSPLFRKPYLARMLLVVAIQINIMIW